MSAIVLLAFFMASASDNLITFLPTLAAFALAGQRLLPISQMMYSSFASIRGTIKSLNDVVLLLDQTVPPDSLYSDIKASFHQANRIERNML